jgi:hypothetical protein
MAKRKRNKRTNNDLQNITQKAKDRATRIPLKLVLNSCAPERLTSVSIDHRLSVTLPYLMVNIGMEIVT